MAVLGVATVDDIKKRALDFFGDGAARAHVIVFTQSDTVKFADGRNFGSGAGKECFVADVDLVAGDAFLD